jgi:hypothetical protein
MTHTFFDKILHKVNSHLPFQLNNATVEFQKTNLFFNSKYVNWDYEGVLGIIG